MAEQRIDGRAWLDYLRGLYATREDRRSAWAVLLVLEQLVGATAQLRTELGDHSVTKGLGGEWGKRFAALVERMKLYRSDIPCALESDDACTFFHTGGEGSGAAQADAYALAFAVRPMLDGVWPAEWYIGTGHPGHADALEAVELHNQVREVADLHEQLATTSTHVGEWLLAVQAELSQSAPGEDPTIGDWLAEGAENTKRFFLAAGNALLWGLGIGGGLFAIWALRKVFSK